ncbi:hypothetical protein ACFQYP_53405 [Nonomuraea antimicrobica]
MREDPLVLDAYLTGASR